MPEVLEAPETTQEVVWQPFQDDEQPMTITQLPSRQGNPLSDRTPRAVVQKQTRRRPPQSKAVYINPHCMEGSLHMLTREHPFLYALATVG